MISYPDEITIQKASLASDGRGGHTESTGERKIKGFIRALSGKEQVARGKKNVISTHRLYCEDLTIEEENKAVFAGKTYNILFVNPKRDLDGASQHVEVDMELVQ